MMMTGNPKVKKISTSHPITRVTMFWPEAQSTEVSIAEYECCSPSTSVQSNADITF